MNNQSFEIPTSIGRGSSLATLKKEIIKLFVKKGDPIGSIGLDWIGLDWIRLHCRYIMNSCPLSIYE